MTQGYRKIPGDRCYGGLDLNPAIYSCSYSGMILGLISLKSFLSLIIMGAIFYFGWPLIEALLIVLPIPDPKEMKDKFMSLFGSSTGAKKTPGRGHQKSKPTGKAEGYKEGFGEAPQSLEEEEDDDEDDVGRPINLKDKKSLNYDSDEETHG